MPLDLTKKEWPPRGKRVGRSSVHDAYVTEGQAAALRLGFPGMVMPIDGDEAYITTLAVDDRDVVYGGTGGTRAHVFAAMIRGISGVVVDLMALEENARTTAVIEGPNKRIISTTAPGASRPDTDPQDCMAEGEGAIYFSDRFSLPPDLVHEWHFYRTQAEKACVPLPGEGIACAVLVDGADGKALLCGLGEKTGTLFLWDPESSEADLIQPVDEHEMFSHCMVRASDGTVYGTATEGTLWRFDPAAREFCMTDMALPTLAGRSKRNQADSFALDPITGVIYGGGAADGVLFAFDPAAGTVRSLGKPTGFRGCKGAAVTSDGRFFGIAGRAGEMPHLFCYTPDSHELRDLGLMGSCLAERVYGYQFACSAVGRDGQIFFGEHDRSGHLWVYWPAIRRPAPSPE